MKKTILTFATVLMMAGMSWAGGVATGDAAPAFKLTDAEGVEHSLSDFKGKNVVLEWVNFDCPFVRKHYRSDNMQDLQKKYTEKGIVWLSICSSAPGKQGHMSSEDILKATEKNGFAATAYLSDPDGTVGKAYGARTTPHMFVVNAEGNVAYQGAIDDNRSPDPSVIPDSENYVAAALDALLAGKEPAKGTTKPYGCGVKY